MNRQKKCVFCKTTSTDNDLGPFYKLSVHNFHANCLVFSSDSIQNSDRTKGINGFEKKTIDYTLKRGKNRKCSLCSKRGATVLCSGKPTEKTTCKASFHLSCALASKKTLHEYYDAFKSYCYEHIPLECLFDYEPVTGINMKLDCCKNPLQSHDKCIEEFVLNTKAQSKCPACRNEHEFCEFIENNFDVEIQKDRNATFAITNTQEFAFELECTAKICKCELPGGRFRHEEAANGRFELLQCTCCGGNGIHRICANIEMNDAWICYTCNLEPADLPETEDRSETQMAAGTSRPFIRKTVCTNKNPPSKINENAYFLRNRNRNKCTLKMDSPSSTLTRSANKDCSRKQ